MVHITYSPDKGSLAIRHRLYALSTRAVNLVAERRVYSENRPELREPSDGCGGGGKGLVCGPSLRRRPAGGSPPLRRPAAAPRGPPVKGPAPQRTGSPQPQGGPGGR